MSQKDAEVAKREEGIREKEKQIIEAKRNLDEQVADQVAAQLKAERAQVIVEAVSYTHLDVYKRQVWPAPSTPMYPVRGVHVLLFKLVVHSSV